MTSNRISVRRWLIPLALLAGASATASSCSDPSPVGVQSPPPMLTLQRVGAGRLLSCPPVAYDSVTRVIGLAGGLLVVGSHVLVVDSLALTSPVMITAVAPSQSVNVVRFRPDGLQFKPGVHGIGALVATNLDNCGVHPGQVLQVVNVSDSLRILEYLNAPTITDSAVVVKYKTYLGSLWVGGLLHHFSNYAVAW